MAELLVLEPYYGGSHQQLVETLLARLEVGSYHLVSLPAKKWHWRARTSALSLSQNIPQDTSSFTVLFTSSVLNLAELLGLRPDLARLRKVVYFHENQLVYPVQTVKERDFQFGYNHITTCLAADLVLFNSEYNQNSFLENIRKFLRIQPDHRPNTDLIEFQIRQKSQVVYFPLALPPLQLGRQPGTPLHIVWPHRWEHDKDPATFLRVLDRLMETGEMFLVSILGQVYSEVPQVLEEAKLKLQDRLVMFGAPPTRAEYYSALARCDVVVSTALHETYGVAMLEATALGCRPLAPARLVYPELYPAECLYSSEDQLYQALLAFIRDPASVVGWEQIDFDKMSCGPRPECRDLQLAQLSQLLPPSGSLPECLLAQGVGGTGKTLTLKWFLANSGLAHAFVHCVEVYQPRLLFQSVLEQLAGPDREVGRCDNLSDFLTELALTVGQKGAVLVLEGGERLREEGSLLHVMLRLQEMTGSNVCTVVESRLSWCKFLPPQDLGTSPLTLHFGQYAREELARLVGALLAREGGQWEESFLQTYAGMVLSVFFNVTRSLTEMLHIARLNLPAYTGPVVRGECGEKDNRKLWFNIEPELKRCLSTVHLREVASQQLLARSKTEETEDHSITGYHSIPGSASAGRISVELPFYSKFLLISAFLASYNPAKTDKRFFVKHHGKQRNSSAKIKSKERMNSQLTGPKPFPLERLLAIFYNIVEEKVNPTANIYSQLSSLVRLQLLTAVGLDMMDQPKYKCNVSLEFIRTIGKPMQFDIYKYLFDHN